MLENTEPRVESKILLLVFLLVAGVMGWFFWTRYRPIMIDAACSEAAYQSSATHQRTTIDEAPTYGELYHNCVYDLEVSRN